MTPIVKNKLFGFMKLSISAEKAWEITCSKSGQLMVNIVSPGGPSMVGFNFNGPRDHLWCDKIYNSSENFIHKIFC